MGGVIGGGTPDAVASFARRMGCQTMKNLSGF